MSRHKFIYSLMTALTLAAYAWVGLHIASPTFLDSGVGVCLFKGATGIACPSCGITRSVLMIIQGQWLTGIILNPLGLVAVAALTVIPLWMFFDLVTGKPSFARAYQQAEVRLKNNKGIWIPLVALVLCNWGWNILKSL